MERFADIIINRNSPAVDRVFTYQIQPQFQHELEAGMLVKVPFNREHLEGVVIRVHEERPEGISLRPVEDLLSERVLLPRELLRLSAWLADYYCCSRAAALQAMLPAGMALSGQLPRSQSLCYFRLAEDWQSVKSSPKRAQLIQLLQKEEELDQPRLEQAGFSASFLRQAEQAGLLLRERRAIREE